MSLADCLAKIQLDPDAVAEIQASVEKRVAGGMPLDAAEKAAVDEHLRAIQADVEDIRRQLKAPEPVEVAAPEQPADMTEEPVDPEQVIEQALDRLFQRDVETHLLGAERGERQTADTTRLSGAEKSAIRAGAKAAKLTIAEVEAVVRGHKAAHPPEAGWAPLTFVRLENIGKDGKPKWDYVYQTIPYSFNADSKGRALEQGSKSYEKRVQAVALRMRDEVAQVNARALAGDKTAKNIIEQAGWYREMRTRLRQEFGALGDVFADLLGATSPNTPVRDNWANAVDVLRRATRGDYDALAPQWEAWAANVEQLETAFRGWFDSKLAEGLTKKAVKALPEYKEWKDKVAAAREIPDALVPKKEPRPNSKGEMVEPKYGFNGRNIVRAFVDLWRTVREADPDIGRGGQAPKAFNFSGNLIGFRQRATIDVWAARMLQRLAGEPRIPSMAEGGVSGEMLDDGRTTLQFGFGQDVFSAAVASIKADPELSKNETLSGINDDDLQALVWFIEKEVWTKNDWTSAAGEGGSFEFEADLAGQSDQDRIRELRRIADSSRSTPEQKAAAVAELKTLQRPVDRFIGGLSIQQSKDTQGVDYVPDDPAMAGLANAVKTAIYEGDPKATVLASKTLATEGRYGGVERSLDIEVVARDGFDPAPLFRRMIEKADAAKQDSTFLSRVLRSGEEVDLARHRPGIELYFREAGDIKALQPILDELAAAGIEFYTVAVDARPGAGTKPGAMPQAVGVRFQYVPEFGVRYGFEADLAGMTDEQLAARMEAKALELSELANRVMTTIPGVSFAGQFWYDTDVRFSHEYKESLNALASRTAEGADRQSGSKGWSGRTVREGLEAAARQSRVGQPEGEPGAVLGGQQGPTDLKQSGVGRSKIPRTIKEAVEAGKPFDLIHWSTTPGLTSLDPSFAGTAGAGEEKAGYKSGMRKRTHLGLLGRYQLEGPVAAAAKTAYKVTVDPKEVYDLSTDPRGLMRGAKNLQAGLDAARKAGFKYFYSSQQGPWGPFLFTNDAVEGLTELSPSEQQKLARPPMPKPTKAEEQAYKYGQSEVRVVGRKELGDSWTSRDQFFQSAYHGTGNTQPYAGGKLRYDMVNSAGGEGTQIEGWGIYVTGSKGAGKFYREQNSGMKTQDVMGAAVQGMNALYDEAVSLATKGLPHAESMMVVGELADLIGGLVSPEYLRGQAELASQSEGRTEQAIAAGLQFALANGYEKVYADYVAAEKVRKEETGRLYTVEIPDDTGDNYLDWDEYLSQQSPSVRMKVGAAAREAGITINWSTSRGEDAYSAIADALEGDIPDDVPNDGSIGKKRASDALRAAGIVGNKYLGNEKQGPYYNYVIFQDVPYTSYEQSGDGARGGLTIVDDQYIVELYDGADLSTVLHETAHIFLEELRGIVASGMASEQTLKDWSTLSEWWGSEWATANKTERRAMHEKFASAFETYLLEGKAPSAKLADAFGTFRQWLTRIYDRVVNGDPAAGIDKLLQDDYGVRVNLTDEVREVFDRLLTLAPEVEAEAVASEFSVPPGAKGEDDKAKASRTRIADLLESAKRHLEERLFAKRTAIIAKHKETWKAEAEADLAELPVYLATELLKARKLKLDVTEVLNLYGDVTAKALTAKGLAAATGDLVHPDAIAAEAGFATGKEMVEEMKVAPSFEYAVKKAVKARADQAWQEYGTADAMTETHEFADALKAGADYLAQVLGRKPVGAKEIKDEAAKLMASMPVSQATRPDRFLQEMSRNQRLEKQALTKGDLELAAAKNRMARIQMELARLAKKNKEQVAAIVARAEKLRQADPQKIDYQYWHAALELAARHGLIKPLNLTAPKDGWKSLAQLFVERLDPSSPEYDGGMDLRAMASSSVVTGADARQYTDMPVLDLVEIDNVLRSLEHDGRERVADRILGEEMSAAETAGKLAELMAKNVTPMSPKNEFSWLRPLVDFKDRYIAGLRMWQFVARAIDGTPKADTGLASKVLQNSLHEASNAQFKQRVKLDKKLHPLYEYIAKRAESQPRYLDVKVPVTQAMKQAGLDGWTYERVFCAALNMGNAYNLEGLARGYGLTLDDGSPDMGRLQKLTSVLTAKDWETVQKVWDTIETELRDPLAEAYEQVTGIPMGIVEADPIEVTTKDGETVKLRGGYYPIKFDPRLSITVQERAEADELTLRAQTMAPIISTKSGMTKSRTDTGGRAFDLRLRVLDSHIDDTLQYIHFRKLLKDLNKLTRQPAFKESFVQHFGLPSYFELRKYLADIGLPTIEQNDVISGTVNKLRSHVSPWLLSFNLSSLLKQTPQVLTFMADNPKAYFAGVSEMLREGPVASSRRLRNESEYLAFRAQNVDRDAAYFMKQVDPLSKRKMRKVAELGMNLFAMADHVLVAPAWQGVYSARYADLVKTMSPEAAAKQARTDADNQIRGTMPGSARAMDQNGWLRNRNGLARLFTLFATPGFHFANRQILMYNSMRQGQIGVPEYFGHVMAEGVIAPLMVPAALALLWGNFPPDEEQWQKFGVEAFAYQFSGIPMLREMVATQVRPGTSFGETLPAFAGFDLIARSTSALWHLPLELEDPKRQEKALLAVADLLSFYYQIPASRIAERTLEGWRQMEKLGNDGDPFAVVEDMLTVLFPDPEKRQR